MEKTLKMTCNAQYKIYELFQKLLNLKERFNPETLDAPKFNIELTDREKIQLMVLKIFNDPMSKGIFCQILRNNAGNFTGFVLEKKEGDQKA